jgi:hypothetical protein
MNKTSKLAWLVLALAGVTWIFSLFMINLEDLGPWGLLGALPVIWYLSLAAVAGVCVYGVVRHGQPKSSLLIGALGTLLLVLYGTTSFIEGAPRLAWTYKHIGVTRYIMEQGGVDPSIDIYQRWPGTFALSGYASELMGISDPTTIAAWAQLFYAVILAVLVFALARSLSTNVRAAWVAVLIFSCTDWTGQLYFAPQPLALTMHLALLLLVIRYFRRSPNRLGDWIEARFGRDATDATLPVEPFCSAATRRLAMGCILLLQLASTVSHQLTPFLTIGSVIALMMIGYVRSWWLIAGLSLITAAYLIPNLKYIVDNYALFNSFNPFANFQARSEAVTQQLHVKVLINRTAPVLTLTVGVLAIIGLVARWRRGGSWPAVMCAALIAVPLGIGFVQNYGGEANMRAFLFASPWLAIAVGWLLAGAIERSRTWRSWLTTGATLAVLLGLFVPNFFGNEDVYYIPDAEVQACQWLSTNSTTGAVYVQSVPGFPARCSGDYFEHVGPSRGDTPSLLSVDQKFAANDFQTNVPALTEKVYSKVRAYGKDSLLIFSTSQERYARAWGIFGGADGYQRLEQAVQSSGSFRVVYENSDTRVYALNAQPSAS